MFTLPLVLAGANTVTVMATLWVRLPDCPAMVNEDFPTAALGKTPIVKTEVVEEEPALNEPVKPVAKPETLTVTGLAKPF